MQTPAQRARLRALAARQAPARDPHGEPVGTAYELMQAQLHEHLRTLKGIQSVERKVEAKRAMLADYAPYLEGVLKADQGGQDVVLSTLLVWRLDCGDYAGGLALARYALGHGLPLPDQYQRDLPTLLLDEVSDAAINGKVTGADALKALGEVYLLTSGRDAPDQARAKLHKAIGWAEMGKTRSHDADPKDMALDVCQRACTHLARALELDSNAGVKKDVERLQRRIETLAPTLPAARGSLPPEGALAALGRPGGGQVLGGSVGAVPN
jgi:hypothetical protein